MLQSMILSFLAEGSLISSVLLSQISPQWMLRLRVVD